MERRSLRQRRMRASEHGRRALPSVVRSERLADVSADDRIQVKGAARRQPASLLIRALVAPAFAVGIRLPALLLARRRFTWTELSFLDSSGPGVAELVLTLSGARKQVSVSVVVTFRYPVIRRSVPASVGWLATHARSASTARSARTTPAARSCGSGAFSSRARPPGGARALRWRMRVASVARAPARPEPRAAPSCRTVAVRRRSPVPTSRAACRSPGRGEDPVAGPRDAQDLVRRLHALGHRFHIGRDDARLGTSTTPGPTSSDERRAQQRRRREPQQRASDRRCRRDRDHSQQARRSGPPR